MNYFDGLDFSFYGITRANTAIQRNYPRYFGIQYLCAGEIFLRIDHGRLLTVEAGHVFLTWPGTFFEYGAVNGKPYSNLFLCFSGERMSRFLDSGLFPRNPDAPLTRINNSGRFLRTMQETIQLLESPLVSRQRSIGAKAESLAQSSRAVLWTEDLLLQLREQNLSALRIPAHLTVFFEQLAVAIRVSPEKQWNFDREARRGNLSILYFRKLFKTYTGLAPQQFLIGCRLNRAAMLLTSTGDKINEICEHVGIGNEFYFSRLFKQHYGVSPQEYRRNFFQR